MIYYFRFVFLLDRNLGIISKDLDSYFYFYFHSSTHRVNSMKRKVFYSFHYMPDAWRASQVRNIGVVEGNTPASDNDWEEVKRKGDKSIQEWIDAQLKGRSCSIVLIGANTANRKWINYEIQKSRDENKGIFGIYIHNLKDSSGRKSQKGENPFNYVKDSRGTKLSELVKVYESPYPSSNDTYDYISRNLSRWIEDAIIFK